MQYRRKIDVNPFNSITSILFLVLIFVGLYYVAKGIFTILAWLSPVLLIGALIIDHRVVVGYCKWLYNLLLKNPLLGIGAILLTFFGFPVIAGFLFAKSLLYRKVRELKDNYEQQTQGEFVDYEEIEDEPPVRLNLPNMERPRRKDEGEYDQYFE